MCGRFTLTLDEVGLQTAFPNFAPPKQHTPRYNIAPTQPVAAVANKGEKQVEFFRWGLIPSWAKDPKIGNRMINARSETLAEKPSFRAAYKRRRCLILADGFYEWRKNGDGSKTPMFIHQPSREPFALAGLWEVWHSSEGDILPTCTIITCAPNTFMQSLHNRMPVVVPPTDYDEWLDPAERSADSLQHLLRPYTDDGLTAFAVSTVVNSPRNDVPEAIRPA